MPDFGRFWLILIFIQEPRVGGLQFRILSLDHGHSLHWALEAATPTKGWTPAGHKGVEADMGRETRRNVDAMGSETAILRLLKLDLRAEKRLGTPRPCVSHASSRSCRLRCRTSYMRRFSPRCAPLGGPFLWDLSVVRPQPEAISGPENIAESTRRAATELDLRAAHLVQEPMSKST